MTDSDIVIRPFVKEDRSSVRRISCETAFFGGSREKIFGDDETLADFLTAYFTDYEFNSCFVACSGQNVVGYLIGAKSVREMHKILVWRLFPFFFLKATLRGVFFKKKSIRLIHAIIKSYFKGEFKSPDFSKQYPSTLHINIDSGYRGMSIGRKLIECYIEYLKKNGIHGVHVSTMTESAKEFFNKSGFVELFKTKHSYLQAMLSRDIIVYKLGRNL